MELKAELTAKDERFRQESLNGPMWQVILKIGTPLALYQLLSQAFTILDTMMAAHISEESVSAVAYLAQLNAILSAVGGGLAVGAGIQISRAYGEGDLAMVRRRISSLYALCLGVGVALLALILPFTSTFLRLAGTPELLIETGSQYFIVQLFVMVVTFVNNVYIAVERARGNAGRIFRLNLLVIVTKLSLTALFVYVLEGGLVMIAAVLSLLYGLGKTRLTLVLNVARVFVFRIPVFWFLQNFTNLGEASVGVVMMVSNISVTVLAVAVAAVVIRQFRQVHALA